VRNWEVLDTGPSEGKISSDSDPGEETTVSEPEDSVTGSEGEGNGDKEEEEEEDVVLLYPA